MNDDLISSHHQLPEFTQTHIHRVSDVTMTNTIYSMCIMRIWYMPLRIYHPQSQRLFGVRIVNGGDIMMTMKWCVYAMRQNTVTRVVIGA